MKPCFEGMAIVGELGRTQSDLQPHDMILKDQGSQGAQQAKQICKRHWQKYGLVCASQLHCGKCITAVQESVMLGNHPNLWSARTVFRNVPLTKDWVRSCMHRSGGSSGTLPEF